jgi:hypothetical protein
MSGNGFMTWQQEHRRPDELDKPKTPDLLISCKKRIDLDDLAET